MLNCKLNFQSSVSLTGGGLEGGVVLQLVLLDAVVGPVAQGRVGRVEVQVQRAQQRGRGLAAGRRRAAVGDGGVRSLKRRGVIERGHRYGRTHPRLCRDQRCTRSHSMCITHTAMPRHINKTNMSSSLYLFNAMSASKAILMAKTTSITNAIKTSKQTKL